MIAFTVLGVPVPKGSVRAFYKPGMKHAVIVNDNARTKPWAEAVVAAALEARREDGGFTPTLAPLMLEITFYLPRPKSAPKRVTRPSKKPDLDKLVRNCGDALKRAGIYADDSQIVDLRAWKFFAGGEDDDLGPHIGLPRAVVTVAEAGRG